jgi:catechol 2,3-dioxygenase-like lactoylglutathione lyase family enzyme
LIANAWDGWKKGRTFFEEGCDEVVGEIDLTAGQPAEVVIEFANRPADNDTPIQQNYLGAMHLAFHVDDIQATCEDLKAKGVTFLSEPNTVDEGVLAGWRWVYFHDPDLIPLELVQVAYYKEEERRHGIADYLANRPSLSSLT